MGLFRVLPSSWMLAGRPAVVSGDAVLVNLLLPGGCVLVVVSVVSDMQRG